MKRLVVLFLTCILAIPRGFSAEPGFGDMTASQIERELAAMEQPRNSRLFLALRQSGPVGLPVISWLLENGSPKVRGLAATMLAGWKGQSVRAALVGALDDTDLTVGHAAYETLMGMGPEVLPHLQGALERWGTPPGACTRLGPLWVGVVGLSAVAWSPDGRRIAAVGADGCIVVWSSSWKEEQRIELGRAVRPTRLAWSPDGRRIAFGDASHGRVVVVSIPSNGTADAVWLQDCDGRDFTWSRDGCGVIATAGSCLTVSGVPPDSGGQPVRLVKLNGSDESLLSISHSPKEELVAVAGERTIRILDSRTWQLTGEIEFIGAPVDAVRWSPDGRKIASAHTDGIVRVWSAVTRELLGTVRAHDSFLTTVICWSGDGEHIAIGGGVEFKVIRASDLEDVSRYVSDQHFIWALEWSSATGTVLSAGDDGSILIWPIKR